MILKGTYQPIRSKDCLLPGKKEMIKCQCSSALVELCALCFCLNMSSLHDRCSLFTQQKNSFSLCTQKKPSTYNTHTHKHTHTGLLIALTAGWSHFGSCRRSSFTQVCSLKSFTHRMCFFHVVNNDCLTADWSHVFSHRTQTSRCQKATLFHI